MELRGYKSIHSQGWASGYDIQLFVVERAVNTYSMRSLHGEGECTLTNKPFLRLESSAIASLVLSFSPQKSLMYRAVR